MTDSDDELVSATVTGVFDGVAEEAVLFAAGVWPHAAKKSAANKINKYFIIPLLRQTQFQLRTGHHLRWQFQTKFDHELVEVLFVGRNNDLFDPSSDFVIIKLLRPCDEGACISRRKFDR